MDKDNNLLELSRYIHLNPVRARMVSRPEAYRWSSYRSYLSPRPTPDWLRREDVLGQMDNNLAKGRRKYRQFVEEGLRSEIRDPLKEVISGIALGGERFCEGVKKRVEELKRGSEFPGLREVHRKTDVQMIVEKVASFYGVSEERIAQRGHPPHPGSQVALYLARKKTDLSLNEIAGFFGGRHYTAVSVAFRRMEAKRQQNPHLDWELSKIEREIS